MCYMLYVMCLILPKIWLKYNPSSPPPPTSHFSKKYLTKLAPFDIFPGLQWGNYPTQSRIIALVLDACSLQWGEKMSDFLIRTYALLAIFCAALLARRWADNWLDGIAERGAERLHRNPPAIKYAWRGGLQRKSNRYRLAYELCFFPIGVLAVFAAPQRIWAYVALILTLILQTALWYMFKMYTKARWGWRTPEE